MITVGLHGKTAIVTGAAGILGQHFCRGLARSGANVVVADLDAERCARLACELEQEHGVPALGVAWDVSDAASVAHMVEASVKRFGRIDILNNNAATKSSDLDAFFAPFEQYSLDTWNQVVAVNLTGSFLCARAVGRQMIAQGHGGCIVQTASIYGVVAPDQRIYEGSEYLGRPINTPAVYAATKSAVLGLTRYLAAYWARYGIRVNALTPGGVESGQSSTFVDRYSARVPLGRMATAEDMVGALLYLVSDDSRYVTGHNLVVDGGLSVW